MSNDVSGKEGDKRAKYTRGSIAGTMFKTALTMLPATLAMSGYNMADTFFVGRLGGEAPLAAMGFTFPVIMLVNSVFFGLGTGIMATLAHALGRQDSRQSSHLASSGVYLIALSSFVLAIVGKLFAHHLYAAMGASGETLHQTCLYMDIWFFGCITAALAMIGNKMLITVGIPHWASIMQVVGMLINVVLDPLMIFGIGPFPKMGIQGAALATVLSQAVCAIFNCLLLWKHGFLSFERFPLAEMFACWRAIIRYAIPSMLGMFLFPIGQFITTKITAEFGDAAVAGVSAGGKLDAVAFVFPMSLGITLMPMMAQNYGARLYSRVREALRISVKFSFIYLSIVGLLYILFAPLVVGFFTPEPAIQEKMTLYLRIAPLGFGCVEAMRFACFAITACGHPKLDSLIKFIRVLVFQIPLAFLGLWTMSLAVLLFSKVLAEALSFAVAMFFALRVVKSLPEDGEEVV